MARRDKDQEESGGAYFASPKSQRAWLKSGCTVVDLALGHGWAEGRFINIIGDQSTGKTLLAMEAIANFAIKYPKGNIWYREAESAWDEMYARSIGIPIERIDFGEKQLDTVEDMYKDMDWCLQHTKNQPGLYIVDSLDALSDADELEREIDKGTFGAKKAKMMSQFFRRLIRRIEHKQVTIIIISQTRDKIGVMFGDKKGRTGGKALDFYASQVVMLAKLETIFEKYKGLKKAVGIWVRMKVKKNKVARPHAEADFPVMFNYGIDDIESCLDWLSSIKFKVRKRDSDEDIRQFVVENWDKIEQHFKPTTTKYGAQLGTQKKKAT